MTKEEKIKEVLGDLSINADVNGWLKLGRYIPKDLGLQSSETENNTEIGIWRPKSLKGIEDNNGWVKIESEDDLPNESGLFWIVQHGYVINEPCNYYKSTKIWVIQFNQYPTHYQPIIKPNEPLY
jgi:hypothetical protein